MYALSQIWDIPNEIRPTNEPPRDKTNKMTCAPSEDADHAHFVGFVMLRLKCSLIVVNNFPCDCTKVPVDGLVKMISQWNQQRHNNDVERTKFKDVLMTTTFVFTCMPTTTLADKWGFEKQVHFQTACFAVAFDNILTHSSLTFTFIFS